MARTVGFSLGIDCATNVLGVPSLVGADYRPMRKEYLLDFDTLKMSYHLMLDNSEALSLGADARTSNVSLATTRSVGNTSVPLHHKRVYGYGAKERSGGEKIPDGWV